MTYFHQVPQVCLLGRQVALQMEPKAWWSEGLPPAGLHSSPIMKAAVHSVTWHGACVSTTNLNLPRPSAGCIGYQGSRQQEEGHIPSSESCSFTLSHALITTPLLLLTPSVPLTSPLGQMTDYRDDPHLCDQYADDENGPPRRKRPEVSCPLAERGHLSAFCSGSSPLGSGPTALSWPPAGSSSS